MLQQLVQDMNSQLTKFTSLEHYEAHLAGHITPLLDSQFEALDETSTTMLQVSQGIHTLSDGERGEAGFYMSSSWASPHAAHAEDILA